MSQPLLNGEVEYVDPEPVENVRLDEHGRRITELEDQVASLSAKVSSAKRDAVVALLQMFADSIRHIASGKMDIPDNPSNFGQPVAPQFDQKWEAWKQKLGHGTAPSRVIDSILSHGPLSRTQLRSAGEMGWSTLDAALARLKNLQLIEKQGDRWHLKG